MFDRIDEAFKYDRAKQEAVVQSLLQAEGRVSLLECIELVVFLRTHLFELYDIQEKNELISRTLTLDWPDEEWLQVLVRRVFANEPFQRLAGRLRDTDGAIETRSGLEVLFRRRSRGSPSIGGSSTHCGMETAISHPVWPYFSFIYRGTCRLTRKT